MTDYIVLGMYQQGDIWQYIDSVLAPTFKDALLEVEARYPELQATRLIIVNEEKTWVKTYTLQEEMLLAAERF